MHTLRFIIPFMANINQHKKHKYSLTRLVNIPSNFKQIQFEMKWNIEFKHIDKIILPCICNFKQQTKYKFK